MRCFEKYALLVFCGILLTSCQYLIELKHEKYRTRIGERNTCQISYKYHYMLYHPYEGRNEEGLPKSEDRLIFKDNLFKNKLILDLRDPVSVKTLYLDSNKQIKLRMDNVSINPQRVSGVSNWGVILESEDISYLYIISTKEFIRIIYPESGELAEMDLKSIHAGAPIRYEYKDLEPYISKEEYSCYGQYKSFYAPIIIDSKGKISIDPKSQGKLIDPTRRIDDEVDLFGGRDEPKIKYITYDEFFSNSTKKKVADVLRANYNQKIIEENKQRLRSLATSPADIINEFKRNSVNATDNLMGKEFILTRLILESISYSDGIYTYYIKAKYEYEWNGITQTEFLNLYSDDKSFAQYDYPIRNISIQGRLFDLDLGVLYFKDVVKLDI